MVDFFSPDNGIIILRFFPQLICLLSPKTKRILRAGHWTGS